MKLLKLGIRVSKRTVQRYMKKRVPGDGPALEFLELCRADPRESEKTDQVVLVLSTEAKWS